MERSVFDITLDLQRSFAPGDITVKRGDTHRTLRFYLADGGKPYSLQKVRAVMTARKPDGSHLFNDCTVAGDRVLYDLTGQTTACPGQVECQLRLYGEGDALLHSAAFTLTVEDTVYTVGDENIESADEVTALTKLMTEADEKLARMDAVLKNEVNHATIDDTKVGADAWSSRKIADMFCPRFTAEGAVATCEPLEGYPLGVVSTIDEKADGSRWNSITLKQCGKNLFDFKQPVSYVTYVSSSGQGSRYGYWFVLPAGTYTMHAEPIGEVKNQYIYCALNDFNGNQMTVDGFSFLKQGTKYWTRTFTLPESARVYIYNGLSKTSGGGDENSSNLLFQTHNIQIEAGSVATAYESYRNGGQWTVNFANLDTSENGEFSFGSYNWQTGVLDTEENGMYQHDPETDTFTYIESGNYVPPIVRNVPAMPGTNYFYSDCGNTRVTGRADACALLEKLTKEV